eukprot:5886453-Amphidinium_carterae.1
MKYKHLLPQFRLSRQSAVVPPAEAKAGLSRVEVPTWHLYRMLLLTRGETACIWPESWRLLFTIVLHAMTLRDCGHLSDERSLHRAPLVSCIL